MTTLVDRVVNARFFTQVDLVGGNPVVVFSLPVRHIPPNLKATLKRRHPAVARAQDHDLPAFVASDWRVMRAAVLATFPEFKVAAFTRDPDGTLRYKLAPL